MKRRSFLAMLGLAPVAGAAVSSASAAKITNEIIESAVIGPKLVSQQLLDGDVPMAAEALTETWVCPDYQQRVEAARAAGVPEPVVALSMSSAGPGNDTGRSEIKLRDESGRVVYRQWNRK